MAQTRWVIGSVEQLGQPPVGVQIVIRPTQVLDISRQTAFGEHLRVERDSLRNSSADSALRPTPIKVNDPSTRRCRTKLASAGTSLRSVRSPDAPKMTTALGGARRS